MAKKDKPPLPKGEDARGKAAAGEGAPPAPKTKTVPIGCPECSATGHVDGDKFNPFCPSCNGGGRITVPLEASVVCPRCNGEHEHQHMPCVPCCSTGRIAGDTKAGELAVAKAEAEAKAAAEKLQAQLDEAFEKGRQAAFQEVAAAKQS